MGFYLRFPTRPDGDSRHCAGLGSGGPTNPPTRCPGSATHTTANHAARFPSDSVPLALPGFTRFAASRHSAGDSAIPPFTDSGHASRSPATAVASGTERGEPTAKHSHRDTEERHQSQKKIEAFSFGLFFSVPPCLCGSKLRHLRMRRYSFTAHTARWRALRRRNRNRA